ncbi:hypothetical protein GGX14DRAFT_399065 [Mycena pura]|uniref:Uncharacterized protein n=1 Tax=Mycena pura TaxID=153505 RepID=A0AAD6V587_9AGAR|nr:hypothetical protein GGX14DRAFT_399065 [Mycena pura]
MAGGDLITKTGDVRAQPVQIAKCSSPRVSSLAHLLLVSVAAIVPVAAASCASCSELGICGNSAGTACRCHCQSVGVGRIIQPVQVKMQVIITTRFLTCSLVTFPRGLFQHIPVLPWSGGVVYNSPASAQVVGLDRRTSPSSISKSLVTAHWSKPPIGVHRSKSPRRRGAIVPFIDDEGASRSGSCASEVPIDDRGKSEVLVDDRGMFGSRPVWVHHYVPWPRSAGVVDQKPLGAEPLIVICPRFTHPVRIERMSVDQLRRFQGVQMQGVRRIPEVERASSSQLEGVCWKSSGCASCSELGICGNSAGTACRCHCQSVGVGRIIQPVQVKMQVIIAYFNMDARKIIPHFDVAPFDKVERPQNALKSSP